MTQMPVALDRAVPHRGFPVSERDAGDLARRGLDPAAPAPRLSERLGVELWLKWEAANPTGSTRTAA